MPDRGDWSVHMPSLLSVIAAARRSSCSPVTVIFHCMESIRRGPRCARRLYLELQMLAQSADEDLSPPLAITATTTTSGDIWTISRKSYTKSLQLIVDFQLQLTQPLLDFSQAAENRGKKKRGNRSKRKGGKRDPRERGTNAHLVRIDFSSWT
jgi:hypothetical protein